MMIQEQMLLGLSTFIDGTSKWFWKGGRMIITQRQSIHWGEVGGTYMYGSNVFYYPDKSVRLYNPLLPSGEVLKTWFSSVNYQGARTQPQLPLLKRNHQYHLAMRFDCQPEMVSISN